MGKSEDPRKHRRRQGLALLLRVTTGGDKGEHRMIQENQRDAPGSAKEDRA